MKKFVCNFLFVVFMFCSICFYGFNGQPNYKSNLNENIEFIYCGKIFNYNLSPNIKHSNQFDIDFQINKYKRFSSTEDRRSLLKYMLKIGIENKIALEYLFPNLIKKVENISKTINISPKDATLNINSNANPVFNITPETIGFKLNKNLLFSTICDNYLTNQPLKIELKTEKIYPKTMASDYEKFSHLRADFSTNFSSSSLDRKHNIKNALSALNKIEIMPNEIFSFNKTVGKRTTENGYRQAKIIVNNEFVEGLGGGVCQVSSTLYNAALLAGCEIIEANKHSKQVGYVKYGFDAMVNFGSSDLKFRNTSNEKLTIITNYTNSTARIRIFGEDLKNVKYVLSNEIVSVTEPEEEILYDDKLEYLDKVQYTDESFCLKQASKGMEVKSYREKYVSNTLERKELLRDDKFKAQNSVIIFGTKKRDEINHSISSTEQITFA